MKRIKKGFPHEIITSPPSGLEIEKILGNDEYLCYFPYPEVFKEENVPIKLKINKEENKLIINRTFDYASRVLLLIQALLILTPLYFIKWNSIGEILLSIFILCVSAPMLIDAIICPKRIFIFDRIKGTLSYPDLMRHRRSIPFDKAIFTRIGTGCPPVQSGNKPGYFLSVVHKNRLTNSFIFLTDIHTMEKCWSFLVWYMDRNRPLPPGNAFTEEYRKHDYERRKAEGFPPPLYPSTITIREDFFNVRSRTRRERKGER